MYTVPFIVLALTVPSLVRAQVTIQSILTSFTNSASVFVTVGVAVALVAFIWGIVQFIYASGDEKAIEAGRQRMVWGIVALFFIVSVWGIVNILQTMVGTGPVNGGNNCSGVTITRDGVTTCL